MDSEELKATVTPEKIRQWAYEGNPTLEAIDKDETFGGASLLAGGHVIQRVADYEIALPIVEDCERAVRVLANRIETALCGGKSIAREGLRGHLKARGITPLYHWEGKRVKLYSLGQAPMMLDMDGIRIVSGEVRFGYYANTGPV
jgi:hypothetical protein